MSFSENHNKFKCNTVVYKKWDYFPSKKMREMRQKDDKKEKLCLTAEEHNIF